MTLAWLKYSSVKKLCEWKWLQSTVTLLIRPSFKLKKNKKLVKVESMVTNLVTILALVSQRSSLACTQGIWSHVWSCASMLTLKTVENFCFTPTCFLCVTPDCFYLHCVEAFFIYLPIPFSSFLFPFSGISCCFHASSNEKVWLFSVKPLMYWQSNSVKLAF